MCHRGSVYRSMESNQSLRIFGKNRCCVWWFKRTKHDFQQPQSKSVFFQGCKPFLPNLIARSEINICRKLCTDGDYSRSLKASKKFMRSFKFRFNFTDSYSDDIQAEIMTNGPVVTCIKSSDTFRNYRNGYKQFNVVWNRNQSIECL